MPELPEVEIVKQSLKSAIKYKKLSKVIVKNRNLRFKIPINFERSLKNKVILNISRISKYIIIISMIYFTLDYSNTKIQHPIYTLYTTMAIFILYLLFSRQDIYFTLCLFLILSILYILIDLKQFYKYEFYCLFKIQKKW